MSQAETTDRPTADTNAEFKCSCGRTFAHEISLKRHRWVTGHAEAEPQVAAAGADLAAAGPAESPAPVALLTTATESPLSFESLEPSVPDAYAAAMETLLAKAREQQAYERQAQLQEYLNLLGEFHRWMLGLAGNAANYLVRGLFSGLQSAAVLARYTVLTAGALALLFGGITAGRALATGKPGAPVVAPTAVRAQSPVTTERELVGAVTESAPERAVTDFYAALDADDYQAAYAQLSGAWKRDLAFANFEQGYSATSSLHCTITGSTPVSRTSVRVCFELQTVEAGSVHDYTGSYVLVETARGWQLDGGKLSAR